MAAAAAAADTADACQEPEVDVGAPYLRGYSSVLSKLVPYDVEPPYDRERSGKWMRKAARKYLDTYGADSILVVDMLSNTTVPVPMGHLLASCVRAGINGEIFLSSSVKAKVNDLVTAIASLVVGADVPIRCLVFETDGRIKGLTFCNGMNSNDICEDDDCEEHLEDHWGEDHDPFRDPFSK